MQVDNINITYYDAMLPLISSLIDMCAHMNLYMHIYMYYIYYFSSLTLSRHSYTQGIVTTNLWVMKIYNITLSIFNHVVTIHMIAL